MTRQLAPKRPEGNVEKALDLIVDPAARRKKHHDLIVAALTNKFDEFTLAGVRVVPTSPVHIDGDTGFVEVRCFAFDAETNKEIEHPDGRFQFDQPPLRVPDGTWRKEDKSYVQNRKEDVLQAIRIALVTAICTAANRPIPYLGAKTEARYVTDFLGFRVTTSEKSIPPTEVDGEWQPYGDPPPGEIWKEIE